MKNLTASIFDNRVCELGEGPLWHPLQQRLYWFDIIGKHLYARDGDKALQWQFEEHHSAAGWVDKDTLFLASESGLWTFNTSNSSKEKVCDLEADNPLTRSNDGRADPCGGFWIGTMGKSAERCAGAIYRYYKGEVRELFANITIPNSICFAPDGSCAYYTDTMRRKIMQQSLDSDGWFIGQSSVFVDLKSDAINPDGSVVDAEGGLWNAQWGSGRVVRYLPDGSTSMIVHVAGKHSSCPAFGGKDLNTLYVTTACEGIDAPDDNQGKLYSIELSVYGQPEHRVKI